MVYSPSEVKAFVAGGIQVGFREETNYPFGETIKFTLSTDKKVKLVTFPFHLRIPEWCKKATITVNGKVLQEAEGNQIVKINREWKSGDVVELQLPMHVFKTKWYENSIAVERGPITYALKLEEAWKKVKNDKDPIQYGDSYYEVRPKTPWNYGLIHVADSKIEEAFTVVKKRI